MTVQRYFASIFMYTRISPITKKMDSMDTNKKYGEFCSKNNSGTPKSSRSTENTNHKFETAWLQPFTSLTEGALEKVQNPTASFALRQLIPMLRKISETMVQIINPSIIKYLPFCICSKLSCRFDTRYKSLAGNQNRLQLCRAGWI